ncbi:MAG: trehalose-phosphatase, partial [Pseudonocardiaceae bacterium]
MTVTLSRISDLPHALRNGQQFALHLDGRQPAVFLDYDGTLTPIVDRPEDAVISDSMRDAVRGLTERATVCAVSGRDRPLVTRWMGINGLVVAGSHGFDIGDHQAGTIHHDAAVGFEGLLSIVTDRLRSAVKPVGGAVVEPKRFSVTVRYRLVAAHQRTLVTAAVDTLLADYPDQLKVTPGKMVYEIQPKVDWDKGKAMQSLRHALQVDDDQFVSLCLGDDITDEDAFRTLQGTAGIGVVVADPGDPEQARRTTRRGLHAGVDWGGAAVPEHIGALTTSLAIGVDIGGTKVAAGVVDAHGKILATTHRDTPADDVSRIEDAIAAVVDELAGQYDVEAVGIGAAGFVDAQRATVMFAPHLAWRDEPLQASL